jgi:hypothetical protein
VLLLEDGGLFALSLDTWVWGRLGEAKEPWTLPHLGPPPVPMDDYIPVPTGFTAAILHDRLVVMGGQVYDDTVSEGDPVVYVVARFAWHSEALKCAKASMRSDT